MREIKFRVWDRTNNIYRYLDLDDAMIPEISPNGCLEFRGQYTGLKDKNGKEIYEGDILELERDNYYIQRVQVNPPEIFVCDAFVVYGYEFCSNYFYNDPKNKKTLDRFYEHSPRVIGNIYENPELVND